MSLFVPIYIYFILVVSPYCCILAYFTAMSQTQSLRKDMCSSFDTVVSQGLLTTPSYPYYTLVTRCQCQLTAKDDVNIQLEIQLGERSDDGECVPRMWVTRSQHHSFHVCPSQDTNSSVLLTLEEGKTVWITLTSEKDHHVMGFVQFKGMRKKISWLGVS